MNIREKRKGFQVFDCKIREIKKFNFIIWKKKNYRIQKGNFNCAS